MGRAFFNVAAPDPHLDLHHHLRLGTWSAPHPRPLAGGCSGSLLLFLVARFVMVFVLVTVRVPSPLLLLIMAVFRVGCCLTSICVEHRRPDRVVVCTYGVA